MTSSEPRTGHGTSPPQQKPSHASSPPEQRPDHPTSADRRLSDEQKKSARHEPAPPVSNEHARLPDLPAPEDVGEAG